MPTPLRVVSYPSLLLEAVTTAHELGELIIPTSNPKAMRLQIHGLFGALRREGKAELTEDLGCYVSPDGKSLILRKKERTQMGLELTEALKAARAGSSPTEDAEAALRRILGE